MTEREALVLLKTAKRMVREWRAEAKSITGRVGVGRQFHDLWVVTKDGKRYGLMFFTGEYSGYGETVVWSEREWRSHYEAITQQERGWFKHVSENPDIEKSLWRGARKVKARP